MKASHVILLVYLLVSVFGAGVCAQTKSMKEMKYGKVSKKDFSSYTPSDTAVAAVFLKKKGITVDKLGEKGTVLTITDEGVDKNDVFFDVIKNIKFKQNGKDFPDDIPIDSLNGKSFGLNYESISSLDKIYIMSDPEGEGIIIDFVKEQ